MDWSGWLINGFQSDKRMGADVPTDSVTPKEPGQAPSTD